jgi:crotonobetainyl-CoA:carnitine CoA-transferase CaiB-like acyl-CoA transferase
VISQPAPSHLLGGVRVLDLTNVLAGPFASYQLALLGADVIKVETPGTGDLARQLGADPELNAGKMGASFIAQNAGKRSITINLKSAAGKEAFTALVKSADVLVENFRPGVLARLGFSGEQLLAIQPTLVYCAVSGFGATDPLKDRPAYDQIIQGLSGMMAATGTEGTGPMRAGYPLADTLGGTAAAFAISAGLYHRARTGEGVVIDVSMLETAMTSMGWVVSNYLVAGKDPVPMGNENFTAAPSGTFRTGDGLLNIAANEQSQFEALCRLLGAEHLARDARFSEREPRKRNRAALRDELEAALATDTAENWEGILSAAGVPVGQVLPVARALEHEQIRHRALIHQVPFPVGGDREAARDVAVIGHGIHVNGGTSAPRLGPPRLGQHTDEVLAELGFSAGDILRLRTEGGL